MKNIGTYARWSCTLALLLGLAAFGAGCGALFSDPEASSGSDAHRDQALPLALNDVVTDSVSIAQGDQTDWRLIEIYDAGPLSFEVMVDEPEASLSAALHDRYGQEMQIFEVPGGKLSTFTVDVARGGRYFLKVRAESGPLTSYDVKAFEGAPSSEEYKNLPANRPGF